MSKLIIHKNSDHIFVQTIKLATLKGILIKTRERENSSSCDICNRARDYFNNWIKSHNGEPKLFTL